MIDKPAQWEPIRQNGKLVCEVDKVRYLIRIKFRWGYAVLDLVDLLCLQEMNESLDEAA